MDPNTALDRMRKLVVASLADEFEYDVDALVELAEQFDAIDGWLSKGGFLPDGWDSATHPEGLNR